MTEKRRKPEFKHETIPIKRGGLTAAFRLQKAIVTQLVNESAGANLRATKMLIDMMKDVEKKTGAEPPPEPRWFAPADEEVIKGVVERIRGALLQEIQDMNAGNPALAMISLPPASVPVRQPAVG